MGLPYIETSLPLLVGGISLKEALKEEVDIIRELSYPEKRYDFWLHLYAQHQETVGIVSWHLNIPVSYLKLSHVKDWIYGSFNICIPIHISHDVSTSDLPRTVIVRFPLPYKVGEEYHKGNMEEKLLCEATMYIWLQQNCPKVLIPRLFGFGLPGKLSFTAIEREPFYKRTMWYLDHLVKRSLGRPSSPYMPRQRSDLEDFGYLLLEHVGNGKPLSESWESGRHDSSRRANLFQGLSKIILQLAKPALPRIGSWTINDYGFLKLTNRPLTLLLHQLENCEIATEIPRDRTYHSVEPYLVDLIACHDNRMRHQPNSVRCLRDGELKLAALTAMRCLLPKFADRQFREGPFCLTLTDLHQSDIFVDEDWHIKTLIDLEWACVQPIEMLGPPEWLSGRSLDETAFNFDEYNALQQEFVGILEEQEQQLYQSSLNAQVMRTSWTGGAFWYARALDFPTMLLPLYVNHLQPRFANLTTQYWAVFGRWLVRLWDLGSRDFVDAKVKERQEYEGDLREMFTGTPEGD